ncbi:diiron oxygenase [Candidatus Sororendozoicomonas aggregata]|uniref:diiron oxygenase n=1 Tax=Candidatus Sororendozoicomonas aggregata TaxID=3073239 RepID=UPI002ED2B5FC
MNTMDWISYATVRNGHNHTYEDITQQHILDTGSWFRFWVEEIFSNNANKLNENQLQILCAAKLIHFFKFTEEVERNIVIPALNNICNDIYPPLSDSETKSQAIQFITDEAYHSLVAYEGYLGMCNKLELPPLPKLTDKTAHMMQTIDDLSDSFNNSLIHLVFVVFTESNVTSDLAKLSRSIPDTPLRSMILEHVHDEQAHVRFFNRCFITLWGKLTPLEQNSLARLIPRIIKALYWNDINWLLKIAKLIGIDDKSISNAKRYSCLDSVVNKHASKSAKHLISYIINATNNHSMIEKEIINSGLQIL